MEMEVAGDLNRAPDGSVIRDREISVDEDGAAPARVPPQHEVPVYDEKSLLGAGGELEAALDEGRLARTAPRARPPRGESMRKPRGQSGEVQRPESHTPVSGTARR